MTVFKHYSCTSFQVLHAFANECMLYILQRRGNGEIKPSGHFITVDNSLSILVNTAIEIKTDI